MTSTTATKANTRRATAPHQTHPTRPLPTAPPPTPFDRAALNKLYPAPTPLSIAHLTSTDIALYTTILSQRPPLSTHPPFPAYTAYRRRTAAIIASLPAHLRNPTRPPPLRALPQSYLVSIFHAAGATSALPTPSKLCRLHSGLNAQIVADALGALEMEAEDFLPALLAAIAARGTEAAMSPALRSAVAAVQDFCGSFLAPREFAHWFGRAPGRAWTAGVPRFEAGCGACVLARVGGSPELLVGMRAAVLARMPGVVLRGEARSPRLEWLAGWMRGWGDRGTEMLFRSGRLAEELRVLGGGGALVDVQEEEERACGEDCGASVDGWEECSCAEMDSVGVSEEWAHQIAAARQQTPVLLCEPAMASSTLLRLSQVPSLKRDSRSSTASATVSEQLPRSAEGLSHRNQAAVGPSQLSSPPPLPQLDSPSRVEYPPPRTPPKRPLPPVPGYRGSGYGNAQNKPIGVGICG